MTTGLCILRHHWEADPPRGQVCSFPGRGAGKRLSDVAQLTPKPLVVLRAARAAWARLLLVKREAAHWGKGAPPKTPRDVGRGVGP